MRTRTRIIAAVLSLALGSGLLGYYQVVSATEGPAGQPAGQAGTPPAPAGPLKRAYWRLRGIRTARLIIRTTDAKTGKPIPGAGCVVAETGQRVETNAQGVAPAIDAPVFRNPRLEEMLAELHGQLMVICYKKGYRDSLYMGVRMHEGAATEPSVWMFPIGTGDRRIEPTLYQMPIHRLWRIRAADKYRLRDEGEGPERPQLSNPAAGVAPPEMMDASTPQTPVYPGPRLLQPRVETQTPAPSR